MNNNNSNTLNENYPYEHLIIENVFKEDFYKKLKKNFQKINYLNHVIIV